LKLAEVLADKYELILTARSIESLEKVKENLE
jgi:short-subunit dehydrogenase